MPIFINTISILFIIFILITPFFIFKISKRIKSAYRLPLYLVIGFIISIILIFGFSYWVDKSNNFLLGYYGYNMDGMNDEENYNNVNPENSEKVKRILISQNSIGWPLKAFFSTLIYIPYLTIIYLIIFFIFKTHQKT